MREVLSGKALRQVLATRDIDHAWQLLSQAFDPLLVLHHHLGKVKALDPFTEKMVEELPAEAPEWMLEMEYSINDVLRLGSRREAMW